MLLPYGDEGMNIFYLLAVWIIAVLLILIVGTVGDVVLYNDRNRRHLVEKTTPVKDERDVWRIYLEQNLWEALLFTFGFITGSVTLWIIA